MGLLTIAAKIILMITNTLLGLMAIAILAIGGIILGCGNLLKELSAVKSILDEINTSMTAATGQGFDTSNLDYSTVFLEIGVILIVVGVFLLGLAIVGYVAACCGLKVLLLVYGIIVGAIFLGSLAIVIVIAVKPEEFKKHSKDGLRRTLDEYRGFDSSNQNTKTIAWNTLMQWKGCCGPEDYTDFTSLSSWTYRDTYSLVAPISCCKTLPTTSLSSGAPSCATSPTETDSYYKESCVDKLFQDYIEDNKAALVTPVAITLLCMLGIVVCTIILFRDKSFLGII